jgi:hypothetical protein
MGFSGQAALTPVDNSENRVNANSGRMVMVLLLCGLREVQVRPGSGWQEVDLPGSCQPVSNCRRGMLSGSAGNVNRARRAATGVRTVRPPPAWRHPGAGHAIVINCHPPDVESFF